MRKLKTYQKIYLIDHRNPPLDLIIKAIIYDLISKNILKITDDKFITREDSDSLDFIENLIISSLEIKYLVRLDAFIKGLIKFLDKKFKYVDKKYDLSIQIKNYLLESGFMVKKRSFFFVRYELSDAIKILIKGELKNIQSIPKMVTDSNFDLNKMIDDIIESYFQKNESNMDITSLKYLK